MSNVQANNLVDLSGGIPTVKGQRLIPTAWVNFDGTGTVSIRDSENVSSITDNGIGDWTITFDATMSNANYCMQSLSNAASTTNARDGMMVGLYGGTAGAGEDAYSKGSMTTTSVRIGAKRGGYSADNSAVADTDLVSVMILGGQ